MAVPPTRSRPGLEQQLGHKRQGRIIKKQEARCLTAAVVVVVLTKVLIRHYMYKMVRAMQYYRYKGIF